jgi:hypothetical protein
MIVIAVDPAPAKPSTVFDGVFHSFSCNDLTEFLRSRQNDGLVLVCWDAPLTGPADASTPGSTLSDFSQRTIEQFFSREATGFKTPPGISVRPYSGCPHWAISRAVVGLPRVGPWDVKESDLPFLLLASGSPPDHQGHFIVEVHPAVAAWLWCSPQPRTTASWYYKKDQRVLTEMWKLVRPYMPPEAQAVEPQNDDEFDALVAFALGVHWLKGSGKVSLLGSRPTGSFLLPASTKLSEAFARFCQQQIA